MSRKYWKNMKNQELCKQTESFNVSEQNPTRKQTEAVNINEHFLLKQFPEDVHDVWCVSIVKYIQHIYQLYNDHACAC